MPQALANVAIGKQKNAALTGSNIEFISLTSQSNTEFLYIRGICS